MAYYPRTAIYRATVRRNVRLSLRRWSYFFR